jgi:hypothetical protein
MVRANTTQGYRSFAVSPCEAVHTWPEIPIGLVSAVLARLGGFSVDHGRTSPAGLSAFIAPMLMTGTAAAVAAGHRSAANAAEQRSRHRHLGQLEHHVAAVAHDPGADLDQLLAQDRERSMLDSSGSAKVRRKLARLVGEGMELEPYGVMPESIAGQSRPADCVLGGARRVARLLRSDGRGTAPAWLHARAQSVLRAVAGQALPKMEGRSGRKQPVGGAGKTYRLRGLPWVDSVEKLCCVEAVSLIHSNNRRGSEDDDG